MIVNIFGASGSGKTTLIRNAFQAGVAGKWIRELTNKSILNSESPRLALSTMPIPKFRGSVESYLNLFDIIYEENSDDSVEIQALYNTVFNLLSEGKTSRDMLRSVETLSAGEGRRLSVLRCLLENAELRVIDEPFANSDRDLHYLIYSAINANGNSILLTHEAIQQPDMNSSGLILVTVEEARSCLQKVLHAQ